MKDHEELIRFSDAPLDWRQALDQQSNIQIQYPVIVFPQKCIVCGGKHETSEVKKLSGSKTVKTTIIPTGTVTVNVPVEMEVNIPLCVSHRDQMSLSKKRKSLGFVISAIVGILFSMPLFLITLDNDVISGILFSLLLGNLAGVLLGALFMRILDTYRKRSNLQPFFFYQPYDVSLVDDSNPTTMKVSIRIDNEAVGSEFEALNKKRKKISDKRQRTYKDSRKSLSERILNASANGETNIVGELYSRAGYEDRVNAIHELGEIGGKTALEALKKMMDVNSSERANPRMTYGFDYKESQNLQKLETEIMLAISKALKN